MTDVNTDILESTPTATPQTGSEPKAEAPKEEPQKVEAPKATEPPKEEPKPEAPKTEEGKTETEGDKKPESEKTEEPKKVVPEKYDLKLSEDSPLDPAHLAQFERLAKQQGLSQDEAAAALKRQEAEVSTIYENLSEQWKTDTKNDPEIGGAKFEENVNHAHQALERFGSPALKQALNKTGYGNHPELIRAFAKVGRAMADDTFIRPGGSMPTKEKTLEEIFYPDGQNPAAGKE